MTRMSRWSLVGILAASMVGTAAFAGEGAAPDKKTERLWKGKCSSCHGMDGKAQTEQGKKMKINDYSAAAWQAKRTDADLKKAILEGVKAEKDGVKQEMDGYKDALSEEQITNLIGYIRSLKK